jgi:mRNA interferase MazF
MGQFAVGQIVSALFPFSDLSSRKYRPALIVAIVDFDDLILCQITSKPYASSMAIDLLKSDFIKGKLPIKSYIRPDKLFTAEVSIVSKVYGELKPAKLQQVKKTLRSLFAESK